MSSKVAKAMADPASLHDEINSSASGSGKAVLVSESAREDDLARSGTTLRTRPPWYFELSSASRLLTDQLGTLDMLLRRAVGEVEPHYVDPGGNHAVEHFLSAGSRPQCRYDFRFA